MGIGLKPAEILELSVVALAHAIRAREVSCIAAMEATIARSEGVQDTLNCFVRIDREQAMNAAGAADGELARGCVRGPLHGVPMAHKDMFYREGLPSSCGSKIKRDVLAPSTATVLSRLDASGAIQFGVLNMAEFAYGPTGHNYHFGHCRNPWDRDYITGGSSSGSAAAVAARASFAALGSDTTGSLRAPAAFCGLSAIKPTWGRVSRFGAMPLSFSMDTVGPLARTVEDCALILQVIAGADPRDPTSSQRPVPDYMAQISRSVKGIRVGIPKRYFNENIDPEIDGLARASLEVYEMLGAELVEVDLPEMEPWSHAAILIVAAEAGALHANWMRSRPDDYSDQVRARLELGMAVPAMTYIECLRLRSEALQEFSTAVFTKVDVVHVPSVGFQTPTIADTDVGASPAMAKMVSDITRLTRPASFLGLPALSVPVGFTASGMPTAVQLIGRRFDEGGLLAAGHAYQRATQWHKASPNS